MCPINEGHGRTVVVQPTTDEPFTPIGPNRSLALKILSIYPGVRPHGSMLVASSVRNPSIFDAQPLAMHYVFDHVQPGQVATPSADVAGSNVIYYSPAVIESSLKVSLRLAFDDFDADRYRKWVDVFAKAAGLPVFALGFAAGLGGAAAAQGILYAAQKALNLGIDLWDNNRDGSNDWSSTWTLNLSEEGLAKAKAGYLVFLADKTEPDILGTETRTNEGLFTIDPKDGTLRPETIPEQLATLDEPYVVATLSGREDSTLEAWTRGAVSAAVAERFLGAGPDAATSVGDILEVYNDVVMARKISALDLKLEDASGTAADEMKAQREALVKNVLDKDLKAALKVKVA